MKVKNYSISLIRLISMLMIISCHILQGLGNKMAFWINVGVQIFFFISGFLYGNKNIDNIKEFYQKRIIKVLVPYSIFSIIICLIEVLFLKSHYTFGTIFANTIGIGVYTGNYYLISHTWFVTYILICYLLLPLFSKILNKTFKKNCVYFLMTCFVLYILQYYGIVNVKAAWIVNFLLGYFYCKSYNNSKNRKMVEIAIFALFILVFPLALVYQEGYNVSLPNFLNDNALYIMDYGHVLLGSILFITLYKLFNKINIKYNIILKFSDKYSYYIYLVHQVFILYSFSLLFITNYLLLNLVLIFIAIIISAVVLEHLCTLIIGYLSKVTKKRLSGKKEITAK